MAIPAAIPVYEAESGWRLPVTLTETNGKPVTVATSGARLPVVVVESGGVPVVDISGLLGISQFIVTNSGENVTNGGEVVTNGAP